MEKPALEAGAERAKMDKLISPPKLTTLKLFAQKSQNKTQPFMQKGAFTFLVPTKSIRSVYTWEFLYSCWISKAKPLLSFV